MRKATNYIPIFFLVIQFFAVPIVTVQAQPPNDDWANTIMLTLPSISTTGTNVGATTETGEQHLTEPPAGASVWWSFVAPFDGEVTVDTFGSDFDTMLHIYEGGENGFDQLTLWDWNDDSNGLQSYVSFPIFAGHRYEIRVSGYNGAQGNIVLNGPSNDNWPRSFPMDVPGITFGHNVGATTQDPTEPDLDDPPAGATVWWEFIAAQNGFVTIDTLGSNFDTILHVYSGIGAEFFADLTLEAWNDDTPIGLQSRVKIPVTAGEKYHVRVAGYNGAQGNIVLRGSFPPPNDDWADTINVALPFTTTGTNVGATDQVTEPDLNPADATVWWNFYAPENGTVTVNTFGSDFDTILHVYSGWPAEFFAELTLEAWNDDAEGPQSKVTFDVIAGQRYEVRVAGYQGDEGNIVLNGSFLPPPNDDFVDRFEVILPAFSTTGTNVHATTETDEQDLDEPPAGATVWWSFFATNNGDVTVDTFGSDFDTILHIYTGWPADLPDLTLVAVNDDSGGGLQSEVTFNVVAGGYYEIRVAGYSGVQGNVVLNGQFFPGGGFVPPFAYDVFRGFELEGSLAHFADSDDVRAKYHPFFTLNADEAPVWLIFDSNAPGAFEFLTETNAGTPGLTRTIEFWAFDINQYEVWDVQGESFGTDQVVTVPLNPFNIGPQGEVVSRVGWRKTGITLNFPWQVRIDQVGWNQ